ncbi:S-layer homology domain-containing protein [Acutalibacter sp.]|uniref:S-layer homology domain-containing protein n=1 Tax=Acutalibacter sp. TaxID=1918636 RepID=UPI002173337A|nr:S-layer homology domain-containing protein [Acutalibacter sp.]
MKKLLSILLALLLCLGMCPPAALGANETLTTTLNFTNVGEGEGQTHAQGPGYTWEEVDGGYKLTLNGIRMNVTAFAPSALTTAIFLPGDRPITIELIGKNQISSAGSAIDTPYVPKGTENHPPITVIGGGELSGDINNSLIMAYGDLNIEGCTLKAASPGEGIFCPKGNLSIKNSKVEIASGGKNAGAIHASEGGITITNSEVKTSCEEYYAISAMEDLRISGGTIWASSDWKEGATISCHNLYVNDGARVTALGNAAFGIYAAKGGATFSLSEITAVGTTTAVYSPGGLSTEGMALIEPSGGIVDSRFIRESDNSLATSVKLSSVTLNVPAEPLLCTYGETTRVTLTTTPAIESAVEIYNGQTKMAEGNLNEEITIDTSALSPADLNLTAKLPGDLGEKSFMVKILPASIENAEIELESTAFRYSGSPHSPVIRSVTLGGKALTTDIDYTAAIPAETEPGTYAVTVTGKGNYTGMVTVPFTINKVDVVPRPPELPADTEQDKMKVEVETGISTVPAGLANHAELNTPAKLKTAMKLAVTEANSAVAKENTAVYDVSLLVSNDGGKNWTPATGDNFPAEGRLTVTLPYPSGTNSSYTFTVVHMFTTDFNNHHAGETESPKVTNTNSGIQFTVTSLSPIAVGWVKKNSGSGGGGWYPPVSYYSVKVDKTEHGTVTATPTSIYSGGTVTLTVKPYEGYKLDKVTVTDSLNETVELTERDGKFTFKMPGRDVTVKAGFVPIQTPTPSPGPTDSPSPTPTGSPSPTPTTSPSQSPEPWKNPFPDVSDTGWYIKAVEFVCKNGLMSGYANGRFGPNDSLTRAQFAQIIYNNEGRPKSGSGRFSDVTTGWYANAVNWAAAEGIVAGVGGGKFAPDLPITRQDLAVMLWRYAGSPEPRKSELDFSDTGKVSTYAWKALCWAHESGIVSGKGNGVLDPRGNATRAEVAQMVMKFVNNL